MKLLFFLSAFVLVINHALAKESRLPGCKDPVYACQDLTTARSCGVVSDCIHDIWSTMKAPNDNNEICDLCKEMVKEARDQLLSNETQEEIKEVFEGSCELLQIKVIVDECKKIFDDLIPELIEMLASRMDPNMVCTVAGLCNNAALKNLPVTDRLRFLGLIPSGIKDSVCDGCKTLFTAVKHVFATLPQDQMLEILTHFCNQFPTFSDQCNAYVTAYLPVAYNYVTNMDPTTTCDSIGVCSENNEIKTPLFNYGDNLTCEFCESLVQHLRDEILTNTTKEEFKTALLNLCSLTGGFSSECKDLVNDYFDMIYDFIDKNLDPEKICTALGLCQSGGKHSIPLVKIVSANMWKGKHSNRKDVLSPVKTQKPVSLPDIFPAVRVVPATLPTKKRFNLKEQETSNEIGDEPIQQLPIERMQHPSSLLTQDTDCAFSKAVMFFLEKDIKSRNTKAINTALDNVCDTWLPVYKKECDRFVQSYYKKIVSVLVLGVPFDEVSNHLGVCREAKLKAVRVITPVHASNDIRCDVCMQVMDYLKKELQEKSTEEDIRKALDKVCSYLPQSISKECQQFVDQYTDTIVSLLLQEVDPSAICHAIGLCPAGLRSTPVKNDIECDLCKDIMAYLKSKLAEPKVEDDIRRVLDEVCSILPKSWASECENFVDQYTNLIITLLLEEVDFDDVCTALGVCKANLDVTKPLKNNVASIQPVRSSVDCEICTSIMSFLENELKDSKVESAIREALDEVCSVLPQTYAVKCQQFVDKYTDKIVKLLVNNVDPSMVCSLLQACPSQNIECVLCQYGLHFIQEKLMSNSTEAEIKVYVEKLCSYLPKEIAVQCNAFVGEYGDAFIVLLAQQLDPSIICPLLNACPSKSLPEQLPAASLKSVNQDGCDICKMVVNYIDQLLEEGSVDQELTNLAAKICSILSGSAEQECISIVHLYGPYILRMIGNLEDGEQLCQSIDLCSRTPGQVHLLGAEKCSFGPSYWCKSRAHAAACKAETYCKQEVWKN